MPALFDRHGLQFQYPENWSLEDDSSEEGASISVYAPDGSYWSVTSHDGTSDRGALAEAVVKAFAAEYPGMDSYPIREELEGRELLGFDLDFIYLDLITTVLVRTVRYAGMWLVIVCQAEDRELAKLRPVFDAMTTSLLR